jgi:Leucine-rich repeat (LRR) protein
VGCQQTKHFLTFLLIFALTTMSCQEIIFKDKNFEAALVSEKFDLNRNRKIDKDEAEKIEKIFNMSGFEVTSLEDIYLLPNLTFFSINGKNLKNINLKNLPKLEVFKCWNCQLDTAEFSDMPNLKEINLVKNNLTSLSVKNVGNLTK